MAAVLIAAWMAPAALPAQAPRAPAPPSGEAASTVLALIHYNRNLCDGVAGKVLGQWRRLRDTEAAEKAVRDQLVQRELSELAAGRAATDVIRGFLPQARSESGSEIGTSLERMTDWVQELCDTVSWPTAPRADFEARIRRILDDIEREQEELGGRLVVDEARQQAVLSPYMSIIQLAGVEAQNDYLDYLESIRPKPQGPTLQQLVEAWHRSYSEAVGPTKTALGKYLRARVKNDGPTMSTACREILAAVIPLLRDDEIFKVPTPLVPASRGMTTTLLPSLRQAYREIREVAVHCNAGRSREAQLNLAEMQEELQTAAQHLARFSLTP